VLSLKMKANPCRAKIFNTRTLLVVGHFKIDPTKDKQSYLFEDKRESLILAVCRTLKV
jgi:hypothetical protein